MLDTSRARCGASLLGDGRVGPSRSRGHAGVGGAQRRGTAISGSARGVTSGATVTDVARRNGVTRQTVHSWLRRCAPQGLPGWRMVRRSRCRVRIR
ncbi:MAG: helix-turn-helix domain-containing protein [Acidimicrobiaceae bacterium]|nr:helix-turn-helix domain-containing protein [Acidimicrobiaceae bacterium]